MSQANAEVVQRLFDGFNRRDDDWQAVLAELDPDIELDDLDISLDTEHYRGHDDIRKWLGVWSEAWGTWRIEGLQIRPVDESRCIALFLMVVTGQGSGIELSRHDAMVCKVRAGKVTEMTYYNDQQQALETVGLAD